MKWLRQVFPPMSLILPLGLYVGFWAIVALGVSSYAGAQTWAESAAENIEFLQISVAVLAITFGICRVLRFHPVFDEPYRQWLSTTPWTPSCPLLKGQLTLGWRDALFLSVITGLWVVHAQPVPYLPSIFALLAYMISLAIVMIFTRQLVEPLLLLSAPGLLLLCVGHQRVFLVMAAGIALGVAHWSACRALTRSILPFGTVSFRGIHKEFPTLEPGDAYLAAFFSRIFQSQDDADLQKATDSCGWPWSRIGGNAGLKAPVPVGTKLAIIGLLAYYYLVARSFGGDAQKAADGFVPIFLVAAALIRLLIYKVGYAAPISLPGRIATRRFIIPRHDMVFLAPLAVILVYGLLPIIGARIGTSLPLTNVCTLVLGCAALFFIGPSLREWRFTGACRLTPGALQLDANFSRRV